MEERKYVVPEGMLDAFREAMGGRFGHIPGGWLVGMEAALHWLAENPIAPTCKQWKRLAEETPMLQPEERVAEWQRRMFLAPEPEVPELVQDVLEDLLGTLEISHMGVSYESTKSAIIEAFRRGRESK
jgi:hypothetical protein